MTLNWNKATSFREEIATSKVDYQITNQLNGEIYVLQGGRYDQNISSGNITELIVQIHDPSGKFSYNFEKCLNLP